MEADHIFHTSPEEQQKLMSIRRAARKLAARHSHARVVRKLPRTVVVIKVKKPEAMPVARTRRILNGHKRLVYALLLGVVLGAYIHDSDETRLLSDTEKVKTFFSVVEDSVQEAKVFYLGA
jgi:hypothetical protein